MATLFEVGFLIGPFGAAGAPSAGGATAGGGVPTTITSGSRLPRLNPSTSANPPSV